MLKKIEEFILSSKIMSSMDEKFASAVCSAPQKDLVAIVKVVQQQGMLGCKGGWKDFLNVYDRRIGSSLSDPARRPREALISFLETFTEQKHLEFITNFLELKLKCQESKLFAEESHGNESPEQKLVRLTLEHPLYMLKYLFQSCGQEWVTSEDRKKTKRRSSSHMLAVDCEMVLCDDGSDALVRVCIVDHNSQVRLDELVNPCKPVADYRTQITGITAEDLDGVLCTLADIQKSLTKLVQKETILVGHSLHNDLQVLKFHHSRVIDTSFIYMGPGGRRPALNSLCKTVLGIELRKNGEPHNCLDDACAVMKLALAWIKRESGVDVPFVKDEVKHVLETDAEKLYVRGVPFHVSVNELGTLFSADYKIEYEPPKDHGRTYSITAIFQNSLEAQVAFDNIPGSLIKDGGEMVKKLVRLKWPTGAKTKVYVLRGKKSL